MEMQQPVLNLAVVNFKTTWGNKAANLDRICAYAQAAAERGADIIVLPELALTGYDDEQQKARPDKMQTVLAETIPGPSSKQVAALAQRTGTYILFGMPERDKADASVIYNSAAVCLPDGSIRAYQKMHMPAGEVGWATRGDVPMLLDTPFGVIGVGICYDAYKFPEMVRFTKAHGGQLFINVTALPFEDILPQINRDDLEAFVLTNSIYIANANLVGLDLVKHFMGGSSIMGPGLRPEEVRYFAGYAFGEAPGQHPDLFLATIDLSFAARNGHQHLFTPNPKTGAPDWRPALYRSLCEDVLCDKAWQRKVR